MIYYGKFIFFEIVFSDAVLVEFLDELFYTGLGGIFYELFIYALCD